MMSARRASPAAVARPALSFRSSTTDRLFRLTARKYVATPSLVGGTQRRVSSPSGLSTLITSAPRSASSIVQYGPASTREKSATMRPDSGPGPWPWLAGLAWLAWLAWLVLAGSLMGSYVSSCPLAGQASGQVVLCCGGQLGRCLASGPVRADRPGSLKQPGQVLAGEHLDRSLGGVHGDVHRRDHPALAVPQRGGHRTDPQGKLLIGQRPAAGPDGPQLSGPLGRAWPPAGGDPGPARLGQHPFGLARRQGGQQHLAERGRHGREPGADGHRQRDDLGYRHPGHVDDVRAVELGDR